MNYSEWRQHCIETLKACHVDIITLKSGAMKLIAPGAHIITSDIGALSREELTKLTRGAH